MNFMMIMRYLSSALLVERLSSRRSCFTLLLLIRMSVGPPQFVALSESTQRVVGEKGTDKGCCSKVSALRHPQSYNGRGSWTRDVVNASCPS